jgi:hypothetical protein
LIKPQIDSPSSDNISQCSCKCLKDFQTENQDETENNQEDYRIDETSIHNELPLADDVVQTDHVSVVESMSSLFITDEINTCDCFMNRVDQWTKQFDLFQGKIKHFFIYKVNYGSNIR